MISKSGHLIPEAFIDRRGYTSVAQRANRDSADVVKELHKQFKGPLCRGPVFSFTKEQCQQYRDPDHDEEVGIPVKPDRGSNIYHCKVIGSEDKGILSTKQARYLSKCAKYLGE
jgi:hypothetical protein